MWFCGLIGIPDLCLFRRILSAPLRVVRQRILRPDCIRLTEHKLFISQKPSKIELNNNEIISHNSGRNSTNSGLLLLLLLRLRLVIETLTEGEGGCCNCYKIYPVAAISFWKRIRGKGGGGGGGGGGRGGGGGQGQFRVPELSLLLIRSHHTRWVRRKQTITFVDRRVHFNRIWPALITNNHQWSLTVSTTGHFSSNIGHFRPSTSWKSVKYRPKSSKIVQNQ